MFISRNQIASCFRRLVYEKACDCLTRCRKGAWWNQASFVMKRKHDRNRNRRERNFLAARTRLSNDDWWLAPLRRGKRKSPLSRSFSVFRKCQAGQWSKSKGNESQRRKSNYFSLCRILSFNRKTYLRFKPKLLELTNAFNKFVRVKRT